MTETITAGGICRRYHIHRTTLQAWRQHPDFPAPLEWTPELRARHRDHRIRQVWALEDVQRWRNRQIDARHNRRVNALASYRMRIGRPRALQDTADLHRISTATLRRWAKSAGLPLPSDYR